VFCLFQQQKCKCSTGTCNSCSCQSHQRPCHSGCGCDPRRCNRRYQQQLDDNEKCECKNQCNSRVCDCRANERRCRLRCGCDPQQCKNGGDDWLVLGLLNAQSINNKAREIAYTVARQHIDVMALTETWHQTTADLEFCKPIGYTVLDAPRQLGLYGGGVALLFRKFTGKRLTFNLNLTTFEVIGCLLRSVSSSCICIVIYRPPTKEDYSLFFGELTQLLLDLVDEYQCQIVICGDFNLHVNKMNDQEAKRFLRLLALFGLEQVVTRPTHDEGNTLDLVITRSDRKPRYCYVEELPPSISDHSLVLCRFTSRLFAADRPAHCKETISRSMRIVDDRDSQEDRDYLDITNKVKSLGISDGNGN